MNKVFWYGSLIAPIFAAVLMGAMVFVVALATVQLPEHASTLKAVMVVAMIVTIVPSLLWFAVANCVAIYRVMTDPQNDRKVLWFIGWAAFNLFMHIAFIVVYVQRGTGPAAENGPDPSGAEAV